MTWFLEKEAMEKRIAELERDLESAKTHYNALQNVIAELEADIAASANDGYQLGLEAAEEAIQKTNLQVSDKEAAIFAIRALGDE